jgi:ribulose-5-phosphate 4-epimerase/fuculose-1-phosphate aldolase
MCGLTDLQLKPIFGAYDPSAMKLAVEGVPVYPRAVTLTTPELAKGMLDVMAGKDVCLLYGHGITAVGRSVEEATIKAIKLETLARITWHVNQRGGVRELSAEDLEYYGSRGPGSRSHEAVWRYYVRLLDYHGILPEELVPSA